VNRIKVFFLQRALNQQFKIRNAELPSLNKVQKIVVLVNHHQLHKIEGIALSLSEKFKGSESLFLLLNTRNSAEVKLPEKVILVNTKDFTLFGKLKNEKVQRILDHKCDILMDFTFDSTIFGHYLLTLQQAAFKVGFASHSANLTDLYLRMSEDAEEIKCLTVFWDYFLRLNGVNYE